VQHLEAAEAVETVHLEARSVGPVASALFLAAGDATWLSPNDRAGLAALEVLADAIDTAAEFAITPAELREVGALVTRFINGCSALGLTPFGRGRLELEESEGGDGDAGAQLISLVGGRAG
jgi:hypothetical protein